jgi:hypothetical protein
MPLLEEGAFFDGQGDAILDNFRVTVLRGVQSR